MNSELERFLNEDIANGDITSDLFIKADETSNATIISRDSGILCGKNEITEIFSNFNIESHWLYQDGDKISKDSKIVNLKGLSRSILISERVSLNLLGHMTGIATATHYAVEIVKKINLHTNISATRKTLPGLRNFEKYSVVVGGGFPHRYNLQEMILIKDNHIKFIDNLEKHIKSIRNQINSNKKIELEVNSLDFALRAINYDVDIILLDNMSVDDIKKFVTILKSSNPPKQILTEASGGINFSNLESYASTGVDIISMGCLTHSSKSLDFSLQII